MYFRLIIFCAIAFASACTTTRHSDELLKAPTPPAQKSTTAPSEPSPKIPPVGEYAVLIESAPVGGIVVVNGVPVGPAPQRVVLPGTARGFSRNSVSIKVRFVAADTKHASQTIEELLTPLDKIPASVHFMPTGTTRVAR